MTEDRLPPLREVVARFGLGAKKSLGQNFLFDFNLTRKIARAAGPLDDCTVVEVGPGPGGLTRALLEEGARKVVAIEKDERALAALQEISTAYPGRLDIVAGDAVKTDIASLADGPLKVVANLPYNVATVLLTNWLTGGTWPPRFSSLTLMFQKEVAERITAHCGGGQYGRLSVLCQYLCEVRKLFDVNRAAFTPPPRVTSSVVQFVPKAMPAPKCSIAVLEKLTAAAFGQRRKMLRASLRTLIADPENFLAASGVDPSLRAEQLPVEVFARLARNLPLTD